MSEQYAPDWDRCRRSIDAAHFGGSACPRGPLITIFVKCLVKPVFHGAVCLLATLIMIFGFQADNITDKFLHVGLIAIPILIQIYFNASLTYGLMRLFGVRHSMAAPGALIGASNFRFRIRRGLGKRGVNA